MAPVDNNTPNPNDVGSTSSPASESNTGPSTETSDTSQSRGTLERQDAVDQNNQRASSSTGSDASNGENANNLERQNAVKRKGEDPANSNSSGSPSESATVNRSNSVNESDVSGGSNSAGDGSRAGRPGSPTQGASASGGEKGLNESAKVAKKGTPRFNSIDDGTLSRATANKARNKAKRRNSFSLGTLSEATERDIPSAMDVNFDEVGTRWDIFSQEETEKGNAAFTKPEYQKLRDKQRMSKIIDALVTSENSDEVDKIDDLEDVEKQAIKRTKSILSKSELEFRHSVLDERAFVETIEKSLIGEEISVPGATPGPNAPIIDQIDYLASVDKYDEINKLLVSYGRETVDFTQGYNRGRVREILAFRGVLPDNVLKREDSTKKSGDLYRTKSFSKPVDYSRHVSTNTDNLPLSDDLYNRNHFIRAGSKPVLMIHKPSKWELRKQREKLEQAESVSPTPSLNPELVYPEPILPTENPPPPIEEIIPIIPVSETLPQPPINITEPEEKEILPPPPPPPPPIVLETETPPQGIDELDLNKRSGYTILGYPNLFIAGISLSHTINQHATCDVTCELFETKDYGQYEKFIVNNATGKDNAIVITRSDDLSDVLFRGMIYGIDVDSVIPDPDRNGFDKFERNAPYDISATRFKELRRSKDFEEDSSSFVSSIKTEVVDGETKSVYRPLLRIRCISFSYRMEFTTRSNICTFADAKIYEIVEQINGTQNFNQKSNRQSRLLTNEELGYTNKGSNSKSGSRNSFMIDDRAQPAYKTSCNIIYSKSFKEIRCFDLLTAAEATCYRESLWQYLIRIGRSTNKPILSRFYNELEDVRCGWPEDIDRSLEGEFKIIEISENSTAFELGMCSISKSTSFGSNIRGASRDAQDGFGTFGIEIQCETKLRVGDIVGLKYGMESKFFVQEDFTRDGSAIKARVLSVNISTDGETKKIICKATLEFSFNAASVRFDEKLKPTHYMNTTLPVNNTSIFFVNKFGYVPLYEHYEEIKSKFNAELNKKSMDDDNNKITREEDFYGDRLDELDGYEEFAYLDKNRDHNFCADVGEIQYGDTSEESSYINRDTIKLPVSYAAPFGINDCKDIFGIHPIDGQDSLYTLQQTTKGSILLTSLEMFCPDGESDDEFTEIALKKGKNKIVHNSKFEMVTDIDGVSNRVCIEDGSISIDSESISICSDKSVYMRAKDTLKLSANKKITVGSVSDTAPETFLEISQKDIKTSKGISK